MTVQIAHTIRDELDKFFLKCFFNQREESWLVAGNDYRLALDLLLRPPPSRRSMYFLPM